MYARKIILVSFMLALCPSIKGQTREISKDTLKNLKLTVLPVLYYLPETGLGYGGLGVATFRFKGEEKDTRPSSMQLAVSLTTKNQFLLFAPYELYWDQEKWRLVGELGYYDYIYNFYGQGIGSLEDNKETYGVTFPRLRSTLFRELFPGFSLGLAFELDDFKNLRIEQDGVLERSSVIGKEGGTVSNIGVSAIYDTRDNIFHPTRGFFIQAGTFTSSNILGSSFNYTKTTFDSRFYQRIKGKHILAFNVFAATSSSGTPFLDFFYLSSKRTRGFNDRRFQDRSELSLVSEYRFPIAGRFGGAIFGSSATIAPNFGSLFSSAYKNSGGVGLRYILNKKEGVRLRVDYGLSNEGGNFYLTINEAF